MYYELRIKKTDEIIDVYWSESYEQAWKVVCERINSSDVYTKPKDYYIQECYENIIELIEREF
jgi:hypothetical protein